MNKERLGFILAIVVIPVVLVDMAWSYGEYKRIEGRQETKDEYLRVLTELKIDLLEKKLSEKEEKAD